MLKDGNEVTVVIRKNGQADLYWNQKIVDQSIDYDEGHSYKEVSANFQSVILKRETKEGRVERVKLSLT